MYFYHPHTGRFEQSSRSFIRHGYRDPRYKSLDDDVIYTPYRPTIHHLDTYPEEAYTHSQVNRELYLSSAAIEDSYDISNRSRNRDRDVLAAANQAILGTYTRPSVDSSQRGVSRALSKAPHRRSHSTPRSFTVPPKPSTPSTPYQSTALALPRPATNLTASVPEKRSPFLSYAKQVLSSDNFEPMYSKPVRTPVSPTRELSPYRLRSISPYRSPSRSGTQTPVGELASGYNRSSRKRHKPRVLATKRHVGNYYNRLLAKRSAEKTGKEGKYWPYIDVEDIENENLSDLLSDESPERAYGGSGGTSYYVTTLGADEGDYSPVTYTYGAYDDSDIPEYVPFRPKAREVSPVHDYSNVSVVPYLPKRDPSKNSVSDDIAFNAIVAASAARARRALELINWKDYDQASLVLSVEGEYHPSADSTPYEFRYISRPLALKTPASQIVSVHDSDNSFTKYMTDLKAFREGIRKRLEDGYRALSTETKTYTPAITYSSQTPSSTYRPISKPYHKRLGEKSDYKYGHSLELYPLSSSRASRGSGTLALPYYSSSSEALPESRALKLYDSKDDEDSRLSTLAKVKIKAALLGSKVDVVVPERRRRPKSAYGQASLRRVEARASQAKSDSPQPVPTGGMHAHKPVFL